MIEIPSGVSNAELERGGDLTVGIPLTMIMIIKPDKSLSLTNPAIMRINKLQERGFSSAGGDSLQILLLNIEMEGRTLRRSNYEINGFTTREVMRITRWTLCSADR